MLVEGSLLAAAVGSLAAVLVDTLAAAVLVGTPAVVLVDTLAVVLAGTLAVVAVGTPAVVLVGNLLLVAPPVPLSGPLLASVHPAVAVRMGFRPRRTRHRSCLRRRRRLGTLLRRSGTVGLAVHCSLTRQKRKRRLLQWQVER